MRGRGCVVVFAWVWPCSRGCMNEWASVRVCGCPGVRACGCVSVCLSTTRGTTQFTLVSAHHDPVHPQPCGDVLGMFGIFCHRAGTWIPEGYRHRCGGTAICAAPILCPITLLTSSSSRGGRRHFNEKGAFHSCRGCRYRVR